MAKGGWNGPFFILSTNTAIFGFYSLSEHFPSEFIVYNYASPTKTLHGDGLLLLVVAGIVEHWEHGGGVIVVHRLLPPVAFRHCDDEILGAEIAFGEGHLVVDPFDYVFGGLEIFVEERFLVIGAFVDQLLCLIEVQVIGEPVLLEGELVVSDQPVNADPRGTSRGS